MTKRIHFVDERGVYAGISQTVADNFVTPAFCVEIAADPSPGGGQVAMAQGGVWVNVSEPPLTEVLDRILKELDDKQNKMAYDVFDAPVGSSSYDVTNLYRANAVALIALVMHSTFAAESLANGWTPNNDADWCPDGDGLGTTLPSMKWPNIFDTDYPKGPGMIRDLQAAAAAMLRRMVKVHTHYTYELGQAYQANDLATMLTLRAEFLDDATWAVAYP